jgi:cytochrome c551/c552
MESAMARPASPSIAALVLSLVAFVTGAAGEAVAEEGGVDASPAAIARLLGNRCGKCHDAATAKGGLSLASAAEMLAGGESGPAIVPGSPEASLLVAAVGYADDRVQMPPDGKLSDAEIASLSLWVKEGATWPEGHAPGSPAVAPRKRLITDADRDHWAFQPVSDGAPPQVALEAWPRGAIDRFILAGIEAAGLEPAPPADKRTLLRRATFDLTGLPPTPEETAAFLADESPEAFETAIERLLASPRYGERWGRHWLDLVRYADARDLIQLPPESDFREAWRYRDWVVDAFNRDLPYTEFLTKQIAGDLLQPDDPARIDADALVATGFLAIADFVPGDVDKERMIADCVNDQIDVVGRAFLGLSLACARCHDHKFDPVSIDDYHALAGIFFSTRVIPGPVKGNTPLIRVPLLPAAEVAAIEAQARADRARLEELTGLLGRVRNREHRLALETRIVAESARYALAAWDLRQLSAEAPPPLASLAAARQLDPAVLARFVPLLAAAPAPLGDLAKATDRNSAVRIVATLAEQLAAGAARREGARTATAAESRTTELVRFTADDPAIDVDPAGRVIAWPDRDGLADDALPVADTAAPFVCQAMIGGRERPVLRFDGGAILAAAHDVPAVGSLTALFRAADNVQPGQRLVGWEDAAVGHHGVGLIAERSGTLHAILRKGGANGDVVVAAPATPPEFQLVTLAWGPGGTKLFRNGELVGASMAIDSVSTAADIKALRIGGAGSGAGPSFRGDLAELRITAGPLDDAARIRVEAEISSRWLHDGTGVAAAPADPLFDLLAGSRGPFWRPAGERDAWLGDDARARVSSLAAEQEALRQKPPVEIPRGVVVQDGGVPGTRHEGFQDAAVFIRGNPANLGPIVPRGVPRVLAATDPMVIGPGSGRRELAAWLASPSHPLPARVMVNRLWQHHFGAGLVPVEGGFGLRGTPPSHPALLDHLASRFVESGWSVKAMHRLLMRSSVYRQASAAAPAADPENRLVSRMPRRRLEAEAIRDACLAVSGRLDPTAGGPAFTDVTTPRRSLYLMSARTGAKTSDFGALFDAADCCSIVEARKESTVAPQALFLLNDPFVLDSAEGLAARVAAELPGGDLHARLERLHGLLFGRVPTTEEISIAERFLTESGRGEGWTRLCHLLLCTNEFVHVD